MVWQRTSEGDVALVPLAAIELHGRHMRSNVIAASAISSLAGATAEGMTRALHGFRGLEHVMEPVAEVGGVRFVNDSKATNVEAAAPLDRKLRRAWWRSSAAVTRAATSPTWPAPLAAHGRAVVALGEARPLVKAALEATVTGRRGR